EHPAVLSESDQLTRDALLTGLGGAGAAAMVAGLVAGMAAVAIACRAWAGLVVLVTGASVVWIAVGEPAMAAGPPSRDWLVTFARTAAERFPPGHPLAFYGPTIRTVVVYVGRPLPSLERRPERIQPGEGLIAFEPAYRKLASAALVGAPLALASGRIGNAERATLVLAE